MRLEKPVLDKSIILFLLCLLVIFPLFPICVGVAAYDERAPVWFERGVYAEYKFKTLVMIFLNRTCIVFPDEMTEALYRWECIDLKGNLAEIEVTLIFRIGDIDIRSYATRLYVNIENRDVTLLNGTLVGKTWLWLPANPKLHDPVVLAGVTPDEVVGEVVSVGGGWMWTPQGAQVAFDVYGEGEVFGQNLFVIGSWDLDTGVAIYLPLMGEATLAAMGIFEVDVSSMEFHDTNINLGPRVWWGEFLAFLLSINTIIFVCIFACIFILVYRARCTADVELTEVLKKRRKRNTKIIR